MIIESLELMDYRNYENLNIKFHDGINIFYGENAQGKTNVLEALYLAGTTKSHKGSKDKEIIKFDKKESHIRVKIRKSGIPHKIDVHLKKNKSKGVAIDGLPIRKQGELFGMLNLVFFSPEDLDLIKKGPGERRRFLDLELCQLDKIYLHNLRNYNKTLAQRNKLLKQISYKRDLLDTLSVWDEKLISYGSVVIRKRSEFIEKLNLLIKNIHSNLTGNREELIIKYLPNIEIDNFHKKIEESRERDLILGMSNIGPHRDDMSFLSNDIDIRIYGSQGQQRTVALSLKLAEIELVKTIIKENPILLLDDVLSELDKTRQNYLLNCIGDIQTMVTCTGIEEFIKNRIDYNKVFYVKDGKIESKN